MSEGKSLEQLRKDFEEMWKKKGDLNSLEGMKGKNLEKQDVEYKKKEKLTGKKGK